MRPSRRASILDFCSPLGSLTADQHLQKTFENISPLGSLANPSLLPAHAGIYISCAALVAVTIEGWCHRVACTKYAVQRDVHSTRVLKVYVASGFVASVVLCFCQLVSTLPLTANSALRLSLAVLPDLVNDF